MRDSIPGDDGPRSSARARTRLWVLAASLLSGLLLAEVAVRATSIDVVPQPETRGLLFRVSLAPGLTFENRPGAVRTTVYRERARGPERVVEHRVNAQGFRGPLVEGSPPPGTYRIACVGDSHTFGAGVGEGESWPAVLRALGAAEPSWFGAGVRRVEVLNAGVNAYDTRREVTLLRNRVLPLEPDLVLLQFHANDTRPRNAVGWKPPFDDPLWRLSAPDRHDWIGVLREYSRAVDVVLDRVRSRSGARDESGLSMAGYGAEDEGWIRATEALLEARDLLRARGIAFGVVLFPSLHPSGPHLASHEAFERVREFCTRADIAVYDGEPTLLALARDEGGSVADLRVHPHDPHAGPRAHAAVARGVYGWLPSLLRAGP